MDGITLQEMSDETVQQLHANYVRQPAFARTEGTAAAYTVTLNPAPASLIDGFGITIVPHIANAANPTLNINGLGAVALKDQKGNVYVAGKLQIGKPYTFRKVGTDFLADSSGGSGTAVAGDIRAGKTATTDIGEVIGTWEPAPSVSSYGNGIAGMYLTVPSGSFTAINVGLKDCVQIYFTVVFSTPNETFHTSLLFPLGQIGEGYGFMMSPYEFYHGITVSKSGLNTISFNNALASATQIRIYARGVKN